LFFGGGRGGGGGGAEAEGGTPPPHPHDSNPHRSDMPTAEHADLPAEDQLGTAEQHQHAHRTTRSALASSAWRAFRGWRRARPFWAGVFLLFAGTELLLIPLPMNAMGLILHIGTGGVLGILIGAILIVCALLLWFNPAQRAFYSVVAVLLAVAALVASNLGGFLIGTLAGVLGGSLGFGWTPQQPGADTGRSWWRRRPASAGKADVDGGPVVLRAYVLPLVIAAAAVLHSAAAPAKTQQPAGCPIYIPLICPSPSPSPSPTGGTSPSPSPSPTGTTPSPTPTGNPSPTAGSPTPGSTPSPGASGSSPGPSPSASRSPHRRTGSAPAFAIATAPSTMTASSALITGFAYDGLVTVPTAHGRVRMMQFSMDTITLSGLELRAGSGAVMTTRAPSVSLSGHVVLYATELSGKLLGVPITLTPGSPLSAILGAIAPLTKAIPVPMTDVVVDQPYTSAAAMSASGLLVS
jgi:hypothetical protein